MPRLAANITMMFREMPLIERIAAAAHAGFGAIECLWPYELAVDDLRRELDTHGVRLALVNTPLGPADDPHFGFAAAAGRQAECLALVDQALAYAGPLGAGVIHVMAGEHPQGPDGDAAMIATLRAAASRAHDAGVTLVIEPINGRDRPNWFLRSTQQALDIIEAVDHPAVRLLFDIYHVQIIEGDLTRRLEACIDRVGHVQVAGIPARQEPDDSEVDTAHVFATLDRLGYAGFVGCEYNPRAKTEAGLAWAAPFGVIPGRNRAGQDTGRGS
jgi:hydroxypyruvate isomerase